MKAQRSSMRVCYMALFFANAVFACVFRSIGDDTLAKFGTFDECDFAADSSCRGNQLVFRASFSISIFFLVHTLLSRFVRLPHQRHAFLLLMTVEVPVYAAILIGSFYMPSSFFDGYAQFTRVASSIFILFQIVSIVDISYQARDSLLDRIEQAERQEALGSSGSTKCSSTTWKSVFFGVCIAGIVATAAGAASLYRYYGECSVGMAFTTATLVVSALLLALCVSSWLDVGLLPACIVSAYFMLMCWQALKSNPHKSCERDFELSPSSSSSTKSMVSNAVVAAFTMTWSSWRTSNAASKLFTKRPSEAAFETEPSVVFSATATTQDDVSDDGRASSSHKPVDEADSWSFYCMMLFAGLYMAMVLSDWMSDNGTSNGVAMWVKIATQWLTMALFLWTILAPKLLPDREFGLMRV